MKNKNRLVCSLLLCLVIGSGVHLFTGCEAADGVKGLTISPSTVTITPTSGTAIFTASTSVSNDIAFPLEWSVSNSDLGYIAGSSGNQAVYQGYTFDNVDNVITARDQYGNEGYATVRQRPVGTASTSTTTTTTTNTTTTTSS